MSDSRWLAYAQLLRLPNVFTAFADIALGVIVAQALPIEDTARPWWVWLGLFGASGCLYLAGMVWNDIFDRQEDARTRPYRPLPSRRVSLRAAVLLGSGLLMVGIALAWGVALLIVTPPMPDFEHPGWIATLLALTILLYDGWGKATWIGPWLMGGCRFGNVLLGLSLIPAEVFPVAERLYLAAVVGGYIVGVTELARREETRSEPTQLLKAVVLMAVALLLALLLPAVLTSAKGSALFPYLLAAFVVYLGDPLVSAIRQPSPQLVQRAVTRSLRGLVMLDALLAVAFVGIPGLILLFLLLPAVWLGKWVYAT
jgi:4-hydroxybenzoate polyprenyltransferase